MTDPEWGSVPGESPIDDASGLLVRGITTRRELHLAEAENIAICAAKYLVAPVAEAEAPFNFEWLLSLHSEMFGRVWAWAGTTRRSNLNLGIPWFEIETQLLEFSRTIPIWLSMPLLEQCARIHHRAVQIHPFLNGNGRWSRMLANIWLRRNAAKPTEWPEPTIGATSPIRSEYIEAMRAADRFQFESLIELHARFTPA